MDFVTPFVKWLIKSDYIKNNKLFLNAIEAENNNLQIVTQQISENQITKYIDGSKEYPITFFINNYKSISYDQIVKGMVSGNENINDMLDVSKIIDFVKEKNKEGDYPLFAENIKVQKAYCQYQTPSTPAIDSGVYPALAKFTLPITFEVFEDVAQ